MTDTVERLKELAMAATPGPWKLGSWGDNVFSVQGDSWFSVVRVKRNEDELTDENQDKHDAAFIAAANPQAILSLIAERDEARAEASKWETIAKRLANIEPQIDSLKQQLADYESKSENWLEFERKAEARGMERAAEIADSYAGTSLAAVDIAADIRRLKDNPHG